MKKINKCLAIFIVALLCLATLTPTVTAFAAETNDLVLTMSGGKLDDKVYVDVFVVSNNGVGTLKLLLDYDKEVLSYVRALNTSEALKSLAYTTTGKETTADGIRFLFGPNSVDTSTGLLLRLYFDVAEGAANADITTKVNLKVEGALADKKDIDVVVYGAHVSLHADGNVDIETERPSQIDVSMIVAIVIASVAVVALVVILCVKFSKKGNVDRASWKKID